LIAPATMDAWSPCAYRATRRALLSKAMGGSKKAMVWLLEVYVTLCA
jgi:hypothetical protein